MTIKDFKKSLDERYKKLIKTDKEMEAFKKQLIEEYKNLTYTDADIIRIAQNWGCPSSDYEVCEEWIDNYIENNSKDT